MQDSFSNDCVQPMSAARLACRRGLVAAGAGDRATSSRALAATPLINRADGSVPGTGSDEPTTTCQPSCTHRLYTIIGEAVLHGVNLFLAVKAFPILWSVAVSN